MTGTSGPSADRRPRPLRVYLLRHGETAWSISGQHTGRTDIALTAHGEDEARDLAPWLDRVRFAHVFSSPMQRAQRTCVLAGLGRSMLIEPDLAEWDYGAYEGQVARDIKATRPTWQIFRDGCPGGEQPADIAARADRLIARLTGLDGAVALFSHGHMSRVLAVRWIGLPVPEGRHLVLGTASMGILEVDPAHQENRVIALWNATPAMLGQVDTKVDLSPAKGWTAGTATSVTL